MTMNDTRKDRKDREEPVKWKHERAVPYKREPFDWKKELEQEEQDND